MGKLMDVMVVDPGAGAADPRLLDAIAERLLGAPALSGLQVDVPLPGSRTRSSRRIWPELGDIAAVISRWYHDRAGSGPAPLDPIGGVVPLWAFEVSEHVGIEREVDWPEGSPTPGMKHLSLLCGTVETAAFRSSYRHHVGLVREHLPRMWRYVQNDIDVATGRRAGEFAAISELSYRSAADYERRWAQGAASEAEFRSHEGFLDLPKTVTVLCTEYILRRPAATS